MPRMSLICDLCGKHYESYQCGKYNHFCSIECRRKGGDLMRVNITDEDRKRRSDQIIRVNRTINNSPEKLAKRRRILVDTVKSKPRIRVKWDKISDHLTPEEMRIRHREIRLDESSTGYRKYYGRHEHRMVMERVLGRPLRSDEIVHHIDGNKRNNDPSNLAVMTQSEHIRLHLAKGGGKL